VLADYVDGVPAPASVPVNPDAANGSGRVIRLHEHK
jgi:hypothetical protein